MVVLMRDLLSDFDGRKIIFKGQSITLLGTVKLHYKNFL